MKRRIVFIILLAAAVLTACSGSKKSAAVQAMESYLKAFVAKDANLTSTLSCKAWEPQALLEVDSFQGVETQLQDMVCAETGTDGDKTLVQCTGKIVASYGNEKQEFDLSQRTYELVQQSGNWLVCGYR